MRNEGVAFSHDGKAPLLNRIALAEHINFKTRCEIPMAGGALEQDLRILKAV
jgi:hypothetical protein